MIYYYICAAVTLISAAVSCGFSLDAYRKAQSCTTDALNNAKYAVSRSAALLLATIGLFIFVNSAYLIALSAVMIGVQLFDGIIGIKVSVFKTVGPLMTSVGNAVVLILFLIFR